MLLTLTAFLSMWISNTATTVMMLPIALGLMSHLEYEKNKGIYYFLLLGIAYSANIGGIATIVGSPPNTIAANALNLFFYDWLIIALPISVLLLPLMWFILYSYLKPNLDLFKSEVSSFKPFAWSHKSILVIVIFIITACLWFFGRFIQEAFGEIKDFDNWISIIALQ